MKRGGRCAFGLLPAACKKQRLAAAISPSEQPPPTTKPSLPPAPTLQAELRQALAAALAAEEQLELAESRTAVVEKAYAAAVEVRSCGSRCSVHRHQGVHAPASAAYCQLHGATPCNMPSVLSP